MLTLEFEVVFTTHHFRLFSPTFIQELTSSTFKTKNIYLELDPTCIQIPISRVRILEMK